MSILSYQFILTIKTFNITAGGRGTCIDCAETPSIVDISCQYQHLYWQRKLAIPEYFSHCYLVISVKWHHVTTWQKSCYFLCEMLCSLLCYEIMVRGSVSGPLSSRHSRGSGGKWGYFCFRPDLISSSWRDWRDWRGLEDWRDLIFSEKKPSVSLFALVWVIVVTAVTATISSHFYAKYESWIIINYFHWCSKSSVIYVNAHIHLQLYENGTLTTPAGQSYRSEAKWINIWPSLSCFIRSEGVREWGRDLMLTRSQLLYPQSSKNQWQLLKEVQRWYRTKFNQKMWFLR